MQPTKVLMQGSSLHRARTDVYVRFLSPTIAVAHVRWTMVGAKTPPNIPEPREGIQLQILTKQASEWLIASLQNVTATFVSSVKARLILTLTLSS